ncbi:MAG: histidine phosphatase family protein [Kiritimatiellae bacterium]|nr:histidine phosphatase family protein [Kiritimatiellia bacterium]
MKKEDKITVRMKSCGGCRIEKLPLVEMKDALDNGGRVTILVRHAERPPLDPNDNTFGASLSLTERGWRWAQNFGLMLANNLLPKSVAFYASETFRTLQTACAMAMRLDLVSTGQTIERKVRLADFLGSASPFFGSVEKRMALAAEGNYHDRLNDYFHTGKQCGFKSLKRAAKRMECRLDGLHEKEWPLAVAVTHDINVAAFLAARGVVDSFSDETWPNYLDAAVIIKRGKSETKYLYFRWNQNLGTIAL